MSKKSPKSPRRNLTCDHTGLLASVKSGADSKDNSPVPKQAFMQLEKVEEFSPINKKEVVPSLDVSKLEISNLNSKLKNCPHCHKDLETGKLTTG